VAVRGGEMRAGAGAAASAQECAVEAESAERAGVPPGTPRVSIHSHAVAALADRLHGRL